MGFYFWLGNDSYAAVCSFTRLFAKWPLRSLAVTTRLPI